MKCAILECLDWKHCTFIEKEWKQDFEMKRIVTIAV